MPQQSDALAASPKRITPAMRQYFSAKQQHPDALIFFRMGDFYEMFYEDAVEASSVLDLALTSRSKDRDGQEIPMCGVPYHAADGYLVRLVRQGYRVAICEQVEDAKKAKGLVRREVVRVVSPGTLTDENYLDAKEPTYLATVSKISTKSESSYGLAFADLSTGEFKVFQCPSTKETDPVVEQLRVFRPRELVLIEEPGDEITNLNNFDITTTRLSTETFNVERAEGILRECFGSASLKGFGLSTPNHNPAITAAGGLVQYLLDTQNSRLTHFRHIDFRPKIDHLVVDAEAFAHLSILKGVDGGRKDSLLDEIDESQTPMGGRLLRSWLLRPLSKAEDIRDRLDGVEEFAYVTTARTTFRSVLKNVHDLERLVARAVLGTSGPRDFVALASSVEAIPKLKEVLAPFQVPLIRRAVNELDEADDIYRAIKQTLVDEPPGLLREGGFIRDGVDPLIDELRGISRNAKEAIAGIEATERVRTGIGNLKVRYNRVFGYYIEVTKANLHAVPDDYERKQTIANGERYVTMALKDYERKALGADDRIFEREQQVFEQLRQMLVDAAPRLQKDAGLIAELDVLASFAETSTRNNYTKPQIHSGGELIIREGRHPVVESRTDVFVPNDVALDSLERQLVILTGPNMGGKSTYLRQTAIVVLLAHVGCFVPAREAKIPIVDQIFARIGASDNIARGQSTFMVEMQETARILNLATPQSLVLLDEIGRGTATFDGLSIAWAVAEHLVAHNSPRPKTIFATHYHELTDLADVHEGVVNQHVVAREWEDTIVFMHEVHAGRSDRSYGIQVARLAGIPQSTVDRAKEILEGLEGDELSRGGRTSFRDTGAIQDRQIGLFQQPRQERSAIAKQIDAIDVDSMTPLAALTLLSELKKNIDE